MPVIRGKSTVKPITPDRRKQLVEQLKTELEGTVTADGPLIFEIPLPESLQWDILVVWDKFHGLGSGDRSNVIREAYTDKEIPISLAMGVTQREALDQNSLPYAVIPSLPGRKKEMSKLREAMNSEGLL